VWHPRLADPMCVGEDATTPNKLSVRRALLTGADSGRDQDRSRIATCGRLLEGTDEFSLGQT